MKYTEQKLAFKKSKSAKIKSFFKFILILSIIIVFIFLFSQETFYLYNIPAALLLISFFIMIINTNRNINILSKNVDNINNYLRTKYNYEIKNGIFIKKIDTITYSLEYDIRKYNTEEYRKTLNTKLPYYICIICKIYGNEFDLKHIKDNFSILQNEKSIKLLYKFDNTAKPESVLYAMCQMIEKFEKILNESIIIQKEYISSQPLLSDLIQNKEFNHENIIFEKSDFDDTAIYGKSIISPDSNYLKFKKITLDNIYALFLILYCIFIIIIQKSDIYSVFDFAIFFIYFLIFATFFSLLINDIFLPSFILTKVYGLREEKGEKFHGILADGTHFCIKPYKFYKFYTYLYHYNHITTYKLRFSIELQDFKDYSNLYHCANKKNIDVHINNNNVVLSSKTYNFGTNKYEHLENTIKTYLNVLSETLNIPDDVLIIEETKTYKYNKKAFFFNFFLRIFGIRNIIMVLYIIYLIDKI